jgi:hypothetical protein
MTRKIIFANECPICGKSAGAPARRYSLDGRQVIEGCVDHFHTGHLVTPSESARWHYRPAAKHIRAALKAQRLGYVTERAP